MVKDGKAYAYAKWCVEENVGYAPIYVKKQCKSWLQIADGNDEDAFVDEKSYEKICKLLKLMVHPDLRCSIYDGLEDYAWLFIVATLCTKLKNTERDIRFYTTAVLEIARKNFKTFNSAIIFILLMLTEPDFSRFFSVAPDLALSSELKLAIRKIIKVSPALYDEDEPAFKILRSQIICLLNDNEYTPLAYSNDGMDGKMAHAFLADKNVYEDVICDELGWINDEQFCVWIPYCYLQYFIENLCKIFGNCIFDDGGFNANIQEEQVCIDLCETIGHCIDIESVFPKDEFKH